MNTRIDRFQFPQAFIAELEAQVASLQECNGRQYKMLVDAAAESASLQGRLAYQVELSNAKHLALLNVRDTLESAALIIDAHHIDFGGDNA